MPAPDLIAARATIAHTAERARQLNNLYDDLARYGGLSDEDAHAIQIAYDANADAIGRLDRAAEGRQDEINEDPRLRRAFEEAA